MRLVKYKIHLLVLLGLIILNLAFFAINLNDFFVSDDFDWLYLTKTSEQPLWQYFATNYYGEQGMGGSYRPMFNLIFSLNYNLFGLNPFGYHLFGLIFHIGVCFLVYLLALQLFSKFKDKQNIAILAAVFFSLLPNHSEAVIWIAAIGDPLDTFFYLLAFYLYILYRQKKNFTCLIISLLSFIIVLLTKEIAITLPLLILVWELYQYISGKQGFYALFGNKAQAQGPELPRVKVVLKNILFYHLGYWLLLVLYFVIRYSAIGLIWGYYASDKFKLDIGKIFSMFVSLITNLLFYEKLRIVVTQFFITNSFFFIFLIILIVVLILIILNKKWLKAAFLIDSYFVLILPVLFLSFNFFTDEGERYNYLPSVVFCILLSLLICQIKKDRVLRSLVITSFIIYFSVILINKNLTWQTASQISQQIIKQDIEQIIDTVPEQAKLMFVGLPDNYQGAQVLRNGVKQAIDLYYPENQFALEPLNVYLRLNKQLKDAKILYWGPYETGGYIAETFDQKNWVTGFATKQTPDYIWELWGYDYDNYTTNQIRLIFKDEQGSFIPAGKEGWHVIIYNQGHLQILAK